MSLGAYLGWIDLTGTWAAFAGHIVTVIVLVVLAILELVGDQLPRTGSRKAPQSVVARSITGALSGVVLGLPSGKPMVVPTAFELWGYSPKSSGAFQTVGALKGYGLIEDEGANADRRIKLSSSARNYFLDERDDVRAKAIRDFALTPPLFRALWTKDKWSEGIPADTVARSHLKIARKLNDQSSRALLGILKENLQFTGLKAGIVHDEPLESVETGEADAMPHAETKAPTVEQATQTTRLEAFPPSPSADIAAVQLIGDRVVVSANVDLKGLRKLRRQLKMFSEMLSMKDDDDETDPDA